MTELMGLMPAEPVKHKDEGAAYPKWIHPHIDHIVTDASGNVSVAGFEFHIDRATHAVTVLVKDAAEEACARTALPPVEPDVPHPIAPQIG